MALTAIALACGHTVREETPAPNVSEMAPAHRIRNQVLVYGFQNRTPQFAGRLDRWLEEEVSQALVEANRFELVAPRVFQQSLEEMHLRGVKLVENGVLHEVLAYRLWESIGLQGIVHGEIVSLENREIWVKKEEMDREFVELRILLRVDEALTGESFYNRMLVGRLPSSLLAAQNRMEEGAIRTVIQRMLKEEGEALVQALTAIEWTGRVLRKTADGVWIINGGTRSGLKRGDLLRVIKGDQRKLKSVRSKGRLRITQVLGLDQAQCEVESGESFEPGDVIIALRK